MSTVQATDDNYMIFNQSSIELPEKSARSSNHHVMQHVLYLGTGEIHGMRSVSATVSQFSFAFYLTH